MLGVVWAKVKTAHVRNEHHKVAVLENFLGAAPILKVYMPILILVNRREQAFQLALLFGIQRGMQLKEITGVATLTISEALRGCKHYVTDNSYYL